MPKTKLAAIKERAADLASHWSAWNRPFKSELADMVGALASEVEKLKRKPAKRRARTR